jgi:Rrf2 family protein
MQLNATTDYALRVLLCLVMERRPLGAAEISDKAKISQAYVSTIMAKLKKGGFITSNRGQIGGYSLIKRPEEITMWDVIQVMERAPQIACCAAAEHGCAFEEPQCPIRKAYALAQENMEDVFQNITMADLRPGKGVLWDHTQTLQIARPEAR